MQIASRCGPRKHGQSAAGTGQAAAPRITVIAATVRRIQVTTLLRAENHARLWGWLRCTEVYLGTPRLPIRRLRRLSRSWTVSAGGRFGRSANCRHPTWDNGCRGRAKRLVDDSPVAGFPEPEQDPRRPAGSPATAISGGWPGATLSREFMVCQKHPGIRIQNGFCWLARNALSS